MKHALFPGQTFGRGVVTSVGRRNGKRGAFLRCECGKEYWTQASNLYREPGTVSCGCLKAEKARRARITTSTDAWCNIVVGY